MLICQQKLLLWVHDYSLLTPLFVSLLGNGIYPTYVFPWLPSLSDLSCRLVVNYLQPPPVSIEKKKVVSVRCWHQHICFLQAVTLGTVFYILIPTCFGASLGIRSCVKCEGWCGFDCTGWIRNILLTHSTSYFLLNQMCYGIALNPVKWKLLKGSCRWCKYYCWESACFCNRRLFSYYFN